MAAQGVWRERRGAGERLIVWSGRPALGVAGKSSYERGTHMEGQEKDTEGTASGGHGPAGRGPAPTPEALVSDRRRDEVAASLGHAPLDLTVRTYAQAMPPARGQEHGAPPPGR